MDRATTQPPTARRSRRAAGFTLVELMITVAILGIIATLAVPGMRSMYRRISLGQEMRRVFGAFVDAQSRARTTGQSAQVCFDRNANTVTVKDATGTLSSLVIDDPNKTFRYRVGGFGPGLPKPYDALTLSNAWCTFCGDSATSGCLEFNGEGLYNSSTSGANKGSITLYDSTGSTSSVETLVFIGRTGDLRLFRN